MAIALTVDAVVLGRSAAEVKVLLVRRKNDPFKGKWALPGGFVDQGEGLEAACLRELHEETGLRLSHIDQFHTFGHPHRDPRGHTVSVAHVGHTEVGSARIRAGSDAGEVAWHSIAQLPELAFDHSEIIHMALTHLFGKSQD